jgi:hypothetical protein
VNKCCRCERSLGTPSGLKQHLTKVHGSAASPRCRAGHVRLGSRPPGPFVVKCPVCLCWAVEAEAGPGPCSKECRAIKRKSGRAS